MKEKTSPCFQSKGSFVISCSGACDLGNISDQVARKLADSGYRTMHCLAMVGAGVGEALDQLKKSNLLVIDGCTHDCGKKMVKNAGIKDFYYLRITDLGFEKGKTEVNAGSVRSVFKIAQRLN